MSAVPLSPLVVETAVFDGKPMPAVATVSGVTTEVFAVLFGNLEPDETVTVVEPADPWLDIRLLRLRHSPARGREGSCAGRDKK